ncbi:THUMP domain-containing protein 2-like isoform X1 [Biomphalaria pfeifferi]|uniref:THUMP domain-containing protein 2-like isoform X1 n=1 Tax=Biomphalaria pfeifferi TaxID=112525 RepID=A0AAD8AU87_BIOPF|nr:THUMP domain-containing protein 2-like isoform X1 [Biomphalaria pfeifferi]
MASGLTFFVTTGRGTETFAMEEISKKLNCPVVCRSMSTNVVLTINSTRTKIKKRDGKVFFMVPFCEQMKEQLFALKSVERIFVAITDYTNKNFIQDKRTFLNKFIQELSDRDNFTNAQKVIEVLETLSSEQYSTCHQNSESHACLPENCCKKKNDPATPTNCAEQHHSTLAKEMPPLKKARLVSCAQEKNNINTDLLEALDSHSQDLTGDTSKIKEVSRLCCESTNAVPHVETTSLVDTNNYQVDGKIIKSFKTFRISIKCSGKVKRWLDIKRLSKNLVWPITKATRWKANLHHPDFEICIHISDEFVTAGIPLTKFPLSKRDYKVDSGLRSTIAWIMSHLANIQSGDIVLDPMCGKATVLIEANSEYKTSLYLGSDCDTNQITIARQNVSSCSDSISTVSLVLADGLDMPYRDSCIDVVICDAPFNQNHKIHADNIEQFYLKFLKEIYRVLVPNGRCVLLVLHDMKEKLINQLISGPARPEFDSAYFVPLIYVESHRVKLGETQACILVLNK